MTLPSAAKWTVAEYVARGNAKYRGSHSPRELLVEAERDRFLFHSFCQEEGLEVQVLSQSVVAYDGDANLASGLPRGVKGHLLRVAAGLRDADATTNMAALVDRDYDGDWGVGRTHLEMTDGCSLEIYAALPDVLNALVGRFFGKATAAPATELLRRVEPALVWLGCLRLELRARNPSLAMPDKWLTDVNCDDDPVSVDTDRLACRISPGLNGQERSALLQAVDDAAAAGPSVLGVVRGHDFAEVLLKLFNSKWGKAMKLKFDGDLDAFEGALRLAMHTTLVRDEPLFQALIARYR